MGVVSIWLMWNEKLNDVKVNWEKLILTFSKLILQKI